MSWSDDDGDDFEFSRRKRQKSSSPSSPLLWDDEGVEEHKVAGSSRLDPLPDDDDDDGLVIVDHEDPDMNRSPRATVRPPPLIPPRPIATGDDDDGDDDDGDDDDDCSGVWSHDSGERDVFSANEDDLGEYDRYDSDGEEVKTSSPSTRRTKKPPPPPPTADEAKAIWEKRTKAFDTTIMYPVEVVTTLLRFLPDNDPSLKCLRALEVAFKEQEDKTDRLVSVPITYKYMPDRDAGRVTGRGAVSPVSYYYGVTPNGWNDQDVLGWLCRDQYYHMRLTNHTFRLLCEFFHRNKVRCDLLQSIILETKEQSVFNTHFKNMTIDRKGIRNYLWAIACGRKPLTTKRGFAIDLIQEIDNGLETLIQQMMRRPESVPATFKTDFDYARKRAKEDGKHLWEVLIPIICEREEMVLVNDLSQYMATMGISIGGTRDHGLLLSKKDVDAKFGDMSTFLLTLAHRTNPPRFTWWNVPFHTKPLPDESIFWKEIGAKVVHNPDTGLVSTIPVPKNNKGSDGPMVIGIRASMGGRKTGFVTREITQNRKKYGRVVAVSCRITLTDKQKREFNAVHYSERKKIRDWHNVDWYVTTPQSLALLPWKELSTDFFTTVVIDEVHSLLDSITSTKINRNIVAVHQYLKMVLNNAKYVFLMCAELSIDRAVPMFVKEFIPRRKLLHIHSYAVGKIPSMMRTIVAHTDEYAFWALVVDDIVNRKQIAIAFTSRTHLERWQQTMRRWVEGVDIRLRYMDEEAIVEHDRELEPSQRKKYRKAYPGFRYRCYANDLRDEIGAGLISDWGDEEMKRMVEGNDDERVACWCYTSKCDIGLSVDYEIDAVYGHTASPFGPNARSNGQFLGRWRKTRSKNIHMYFGKQCHKANTRVLYSEALEDYIKLRTTIRGDIQSFHLGLINRGVLHYDPLESVCNLSPTPITKIAAYIKRERKTPYFQYFKEVATMSSGWKFAPCNNEATRVIDSVPWEDINEQEVKDFTQQLEDMIRSNWDNGVKSSIFERVQQTWNDTYRRAAFDNVDIHPQNKPESAVDNFSTLAYSEMKNIQTNIDTPIDSILYAFSLVAVIPFLGKEEDTTDKLPISEDQLPYALGFKNSIRQLAYYRRFDEGTMHVLSLKQLTKSQHVDRTTTSLYFKQVKTVRKALDILFGDPQHLHSEGEEITELLEKHNEKIAELFTSHDSGFHNVRRSSAGSAALQCKTNMNTMLETVFGRHRYHANMYAVRIDSKKVPGGQSGKRRTVYTLNLSPHLDDLASLSHYYTDKHFSLTDVITKTEEVQHEETVRFGEQTSRNNIDEFKRTLLFYQPK